MPFLSIKLAKESIASFTGVSTGPVRGGRVAWRDHASARAQLSRQNFLHKMFWAALPSKSANGTPYASGANSGYSSERTPNVALVTAEDKSMKTAECCIPRFLSNRSFSERKKKMSHVHTVG
ncbi:putative protein-like [Abeliophyllum distichum]|uniref:Uncharacterized protein n=1 Tax=Abeliophyllum distichum TaxID=126358 RepID=A0ABD1SYC0_9LAMI